jgi:hypothetical protein
MRMRSQTLYDAKIYGWRRNPYPSCMTLSHEIRMAIETALVVYNNSHTVEVKGTERGFLAEVTIDHLTDHVMGEIEKHIKFMTGQEVGRWDLFPISEDKMRFVFEVSNKVD